MCLILFSWKQDEQLPLVLASNRDEFFARPTERAHWWQDHPHIYGGRDLQAGGTWMGINNAGYWAALTNFREVEGIKSDAPSRGDLVADYLRDSPDPGAYLQAMAQKASSYNGFNLLLGTPTALWYYANRGSAIPIQLPPGLYGLSNHLLDTPWPKVSQGKKDLADWFDEDKREGREGLFRFLRNDGLAPDAALPETGVSLEWERLLSPMYIRSPQYGTRVSTVLLMDQRKTFTFEERAYVPEGEPHIISIDLEKNTR